MPFSSEAYPLFRHIFSPVRESARIFEVFIRNKAYGSIVHYADHPAAIAICRKRDYRENFLAKEKLACLLTFFLVKNRYYALVHPHSVDMLKKKGILLFSYVVVPKWIAIV